MKCIVKNCNMYSRYGFRDTHLIYCKRHALKFNKQLGVRGLVYKTHRHKGININVIADTYKKLIVDNKKLTEQCNKLEQTNNELIQEREITKAELVKVVEEFERRGNVNDFLQHKCSILGDKITMLEIEIAKKLQRN